MKKYINKNKKTIINNINNNKSKLIILFIFSHFFGIFLEISKEFFNNNYNIDIQSKTGKQMKDFEPALKSNNDVIQLRNDVENFAKGFPIPGL